MRETRSYGSARGAASDGRPYRDTDVSRPGPKRRRDGYLVRASCLSSSCQLMTTVAGGWGVCSSRTSRRNR